MSNEVNFDKLESAVEELNDQFEFISEIFEQCLENKVCIKLLINALLHHCYLPVVIPALVGSMKSLNGHNIGISTALYIVTMTFRSVNSQILHNALALVLIHDNLPLCFRRLIQTKKPVPDPNVSYRYRWMYRLPVHYSKTKFMQEFYSVACGNSFVKEYSDSISFCKVFDQKLADAQAEAAEEERKGEEDQIF